MSKSPTVRTETETVRKLYQALLPQVSKATRKFIHFAALNELIYPFILLPQISVKFCILLLPQVPKTKNDNMYLLLSIFEIVVNTSPAFKISRIRRRFEVR